MEFSYSPYPKISESLPREDLEPQLYRTLMRTQWILCEKIHGAHFCVIYKGNQSIQCAKRRAVLDPLETFFNHHQVVSVLHQKIIDLGTKIQRDYPLLHSLQIHGELFGGVYPHPQVEPDPEVAPVQTGVYYSPTLQFFIFDLLVRTDEEDRFLPYDQLMEYCEHSELPYLRPLRQGLFSILCTTSCDFQTTIPRLLGLPPLEDNWAEGFILRPIYPFTYTSQRGERRIIVKYKHPSFMEDPKYHKAQAWGVGTLNIEDLEQELTRRINLNRLNSARSKLGDQCSVEEVTQEMSRDIWADFLERSSVIVQALSSDQIEWLQLWLQEEVAIFIKAQSR